MKQFILGAVAAVALSIGLSGSADAGYKVVATRTVVEAKVVKVQSTKAVVVRDGYGHSAVAVKKTTVTAAQVRVKKTAVVGYGY